jgi:hypothetical protein
MDVDYSQLLFFLKKKNFFHCQSFHPMYPFFFFILFFKTLNKKTLKEK